MKIIVNIHSPQDFDSTALQSVKNLKETKRLLEKRMKAAQDEASKLENFVIDFDKQNTHELLEVIFWIFQIKLITMINRKEKYKKKSKR